MTTHHIPNGPNKTDAGNGSKAICRVSNVSRSTSPDPRRSAKSLRRMLYFVTAFALSFVWLGVLAVTPGPALVILGGTEEIYSLPRFVVWALFPIISVGIATTFRPWILRCRGWRMLIPAMSLPWVGSLVIAIACGIAAYTLHRHPNGGFFGAFWFSVVYTLMGFWIIAPLGLLSQWLLLISVRNSPPSA